MFHVLLVVDNITCDLNQAVSFFLYRVPKSFNEEPFASGNAFQLMVHDIAYVFVTYDISAHNYHFFFSSGQRESKCTHGLVWLQLVPSLLSLEHLHISRKTRTFHSDAKSMRYIKCWPLFRCDEIEPAISLHELIFACWDQSQIESRECLKWKVSFEKRNCTKNSREQKRTKND